MKKIAHTVFLDTTQPPNPDRSFADVTSNKDYPTPEHDDTQPTCDLPPLSKLPDVKDMLEKPSGKCRVLLKRVIDVNLVLLCSACSPCPSSSKLCKDGSQGNSSREETLE